MVTRQANSIFLLIAVLIALTLSGCSSRGEDIRPIAENDVSSGISPTAPVEAPQGMIDLPTAITFDISGGVADFCDRLTVGPDGHYTLESCAIKRGSGTLVPTDLDSLQSWTPNLAPFRLATTANADNLTATLTFNGQGTLPADETQQRVILQWVNSLFIRLRPQPVSAPFTPPPPVTNAGSDCTSLSRPASLVANYDDPGLITAVAPDGQSRCQINLPHPPFGRIVTQAGALYYPVLDTANNTLTVWRVPSDGPATPLPFTQVTISLDTLGPFSLTLSPDGRKIAWSYTTLHTIQAGALPVARSDLWLADIDGANRIPLLSQIEDETGRFIEVVRFTPDLNTLFFAWQPGNLSGSIFDIHGRYHSLYRLPLGGGQSGLIFACPAESLCIGDVAPTGDYLVYVDQMVRIIDTAGNPVRTLTPPVTGYIGQALFSPTGRLAFVSANLTLATAGQPARPNPGFISLVEPPYTGPPQTLLTADDVATLWEWLDETRLMYGPLDEAGNLGTTLVTLEGQVIPLSPTYALAVWR